MIPLACGSHAQEPVDADWTIARVVDRYPALLETLAGIYPGFRRLRNPVLRALRAPRIRVAQAARVAGLEPADLVERLNMAAGLTAAGLAGGVGSAVGGEPVEPRPSTGSGQTEVLKGQPGAAAAAPDTMPSQPSTALRPGAAGAEIEIDVSDLPPPEPMLRILEALPALAAGQTLVVHHARRPVHLYPRLEELGYVHHTRELGPRRVELRIARPTAPDAVGGCTH
jgi:uncharacterized protein (DUF2249 family)